jgi:hypothetical protein
MTEHTYGITIKVETDQNTECYLYYDGLKHGMLVLLSYDGGMATSVVTDQKMVLPLKLGRIK